MFEGTHTPGPWTATTHPKEPWRWFVQSASSIGSSDVCELSNDRREANANLIAAAPELIAAAREIDRLTLVILSAINFADPTHLEAVSGALKATRAALTKAEPHDASRQVQG